MKPRCSVEGCDRRAKGRGLCMVHYSRARQNGTLSSHPTVAEQHAHLHTSTDVRRLTGISYRMLDYWCRMGVIVPTHEPSGSGDTRRFTDADVAGVREVVRVSAEATRLRREVTSGEAFRRAHAEASARTNQPKERSA